MSELVTDLIGELRSIAASVDRSEEERPDLALTLTRVATAARDGTEDERLALHAAVGEVEASVRRALDRLSERLRSAGNRRQAIAAYGSLRPFTSGRQVRSAG
ncbi:MAG: hypothetical protein KC621_25085 [Myxococcales bacterium]|nr:hypothetical protein [Myxococcales bacterium]